MHRKTRRKNSDDESTKTNQTKASTSKQEIESIQCKCSKSFKEEDLWNHFQICQTFQKEFKELDDLIGSELSKYTRDKSNLIIVRLLFANYIKILDNKIEKYQKGPSNKAENNTTKKTLKACQVCNQADIKYLQCGHPICVKCISSKALSLSNLSDMKCGICQIPISIDYCKQIVGEAAFNEIERLIVEGMTSLTECPQCKERFLVEAEKRVDYSIKNEENKQISREACEDFAKNRVRCSTCSTVFCAQCKEIPYHLGFNCEEFEIRKRSPKCIFDGTAILAENKGPRRDVCNNPECKVKYNILCKKKLICGHRCFGCKNDKCPPCLIRECICFTNVFEQDKETLCAICQAEDFGSSPIVVLSCNHYVHFLCLKKRLDNRFNGPRITFSHCLCPVCNKFYECSNGTINKLLKENKSLYDSVCQLALKRLEMEKLDRDPRLIDPSGAYYGQKLEFALNIFSFYLCYKCKKPYFAGLKACGDGLEEENGGNLAPFNPKDCICGSCSNLAGVGGVTNCKEHGKEFIEYKCRFCCRIASYLCWGNTHFCEQCHKRQMSGDYVARYPKSKLPKCNPLTCEIKMNHPPNGEEFALGCSICRTGQENQQEY